MGEDSELERIGGLFRKLQEARIAFGEASGALGAEMMREPWETESPEAQAVWAEFTNPRNESALRNWLRQALNPEARRVSEKARSDCMDRSWGKRKPDGRR